MFRSDRYRCLNNIPDYKSLSFKDLNDEQKARELPGRFSDLDDQCRRAFGVNFQYCKDLSHGVNTKKEFILHRIRRRKNIKSLFILAEMYTSVLSRNLFEFNFMYH